ncbi:hypothetical protein SAMN05660293_02689 [Dyadobacter psychrophilus]|uniref:Uncharacterized protein n=1 Tax=Dyadobacter psychrophilus TaxID=651661 RepID=A0A1T5EQE7_9BACT|nr:hypothetical protein SAMN05660293_02689 [Dyadobacter psychrophilus]
MAFPFPFFSIEIFAIVIPIRSDNSVTDIFLLANITSTFTMIGSSIRLYLLLVIQQVAGLAFITLHLKN